MLEHKRVTARSKDHAQHRGVGLVKREKIDEASMNLAHGDKGMCMEVLRDIKILGRAAECRGPWEYGWFCKPKLDKVREMNKVRKERRKFWRGKNLSGSLGLVCLDISRITKTWIC